MSERSIDERDNKYRGPFKVDLLDDWRTRSSHHSNVFFQGAVLVTGSCTVAGLQ